VAGGAGTTLLAGEGNEHLVLAVRAANSGEAFLQIATLQKGSHGAVQQRSPEAVLGLKLLVVDLAEAVKMLVQQPPQIGGARIARPIQGGRFGAHKRHDQAADQRREGAWRSSGVHPPTRRQSEGPAALNNRDSVHPYTHLHSPCTHIRAVAMAPQAHKLLFPCTLCREALLPGARCRRGKAVG